MTLRSFPRLGDDKRGAAVIELALSAPFLAALIIGMSDMACAYSVKLICEQAAQRTIEQVQQQKSVATSYNTALSTEAASAMTAAGYSTGNTITPDSWVECSSNGTTWTKKTNFTDACASTEMTARYVKVTISRGYTPLFTTWGWTTVNGVITVSGYGEVRIQ